MSTAASLIEDRTYLPPEHADATVVEIVAALQEHERPVDGEGPRLVSADGREVQLPAPVFEALLQVALAMEAGLAVTVAPHQLTLSTQEAADLLGVARTTLVRLLESGTIPFDKPGRHRKVKLVDLLEHKKRQQHRAEQALADMVADSERLGLYDSDPGQVYEALREARRGRSAS